MFVPFDQLDSSSRIWIYQADRKLSEDEQSYISDVLNRFISEWSAHGTPLKGSFIIKYDRFIVFAVDESFQAVSGCAIDASVSVILEFEKKFSISLLDKMNVTFKTGAYIAHKTLVEFKQLAKQKSVSSETIVFNNLVNTIEEFEEHWEIPAKDSWHNRFF